MHNKNTPEEESKLLPEEWEVNRYKFIKMKTIAYKQFAIGDVLIDQTHNWKYRITYIDPDRLIYGRRIMNTGGLSRNIMHLTGASTTFIHDPDQANAILLGEVYDPAAKQRQKAKEKRKASMERNKKIKVLEHEME